MSDNLKVAAIMGIVDSLERNGIIGSESPLIEKVASYFIENVEFDPTDENSLAKTAVAFISVLDKEAEAISRPDNLLDNSQTFSSLLEKARSERNGVVKGVKGVGTSDMADKGLIGALINASRSGDVNKYDDTLEAAQTFSALLEKVRSERNSVNKGRWGVGSSEMADKGIIGENISKKASDSSIDVDDLINFLQS